MWLLVKYYYAINISAIKHKPFALIWFKNLAMYLKPVKSWLSREIHFISTAATALSAYSQHWPVTNYVSRGLFLSGSCIHYVCCVTILKSVKGRWKKSGLWKYRTRRYCASQHWCENLVMIRLIRLIWESRRHYNTWAIWKMFNAFKVRWYLLYSRSMHVVYHQNVNYCDGSAEWICVVI